MAARLFDCGLFGFCLGIALHGIMKNLDGMEPKHLKLNKNKNGYFL